MAGRSPELDESKQQGFKYFELIRDLLLPLRSVGTAGEKLGNQEYAEALQGLTAVDGSVLNALSRMANR